MATEQSASIPDASNNFGGASRVVAIPFLAGFRVCFVGASCTCMFWCSGHAFNADYSPCFATTFRTFCIWSFLILIVIYLCFSLAEQIMCRTVAIYPGGDKSFLSKFLIPLCAAGYVGMLGVLGFCFLHIGILQINGAGMAPTLLSDDTILYKKRVFREDLRPGHIVFLTSVDLIWGTGGNLIVARILAKPGDEVSVDGNYYVVNGKRTCQSAKKKRTRFDHHWKYQMRPRH